MQDYKTDRYENWDDYEEDGEEEEEEEGSEEGYEEVHQPTKEELEYLALRQKLKERIRNKLKKDLGTANAGSVKKASVLRNDSYGSFFGPSQPVIAQRVIEESKTLLENPQLAERIFRPKTIINRSSAAAHIKSKPQTKHPASRTNVVQKKAEILKQTRDYSFLQSDDVKLPALAKNPPPRNLPPTKIDYRSAEAPPRSKPIVNDNGRGISNSRDGQKPMSESGPSKSKVVLDKISKPSIGARNPIGSNHASRPGPPAGSRNGFTSKNDEPASGKVPPSTTRKVVGGMPKPHSLVSQSSVRKPMPPNVQSNNRSTPSSGKPLAPNKPLVQRKEYHVASNRSISAKHASHSSKDQFNRPPPKPLPRDSFVGDRPKPKSKRPLDDDDESAGEGVRAISMIRQMFRYNPNRFQDHDGDDSDMEANFEDIMREERNSAKIARREDEEQLRMIEEEERRERMRLAKKRRQ